MDASSFPQLLINNRKLIKPVVKVKGKMSAIDLSPNNKAFTADVYNNINRFSSFINDFKKTAGAELLFGGYGERREMYRRSELFKESGASRNLHLGIDIWGDTGTLIFAPLDGTVHSFAYNGADGDYGAAIILEHQLEGFSFFLLFGHLALKDLNDLYSGKPVRQGDAFAQFGKPSENGNWPPHLHLQLILDIGDHSGDYPGVCAISESMKFLKNSPDPAVFTPI